MKAELLEEIQRNPSPQRLAEIQLELAGEYAFVSTQLEEIITTKPIMWSDIRKTVSSDKQAEMLWDKTEMGRNEMGYKLRLKSLEKLMSAIKTMLRHKEIESKNFY